MKSRSVFPLLLIAALGLSPGDAFAHAVLVEASPADGATLRAAPPLVALRFNEPVTPVAVRLVDRNGRLVNAPDAVHVVGAEISLHVASPLPDGEYVLS